MEWYLVPLTSHHEHPQMYPQADPHRRKIGFCLSVPTVLPTFHLSKSTCTQENPFYIRLLLTCFLLICHLSRTLPLTSYINPVNHSQQRYLSLQKKKKNTTRPTQNPPKSPIPKMHAQNIFAFLALAVMAMSAPILAPNAGT